MNTVGPATFFVSESSAVFTSFFLNSNSRSGGRDASLQGYGIRPPTIIRFAPTASATEFMAVIQAAGIPPFSISFASVAPQRVPVAHVDGMSTPWTPAFRSSSAISLPNLEQVSTGVPFPTVT